jgi:hypothetical protein
VVSVLMCVVCLIRQTLLVPAHRDCPHLVSLANVCSQRPPHRPHCLMSSCAWGGDGVLFSYILLCTGPGITP